jgi:nitroimidazol reductase NimA-like FMN-containing flavoprotein (pyridoxamine 5'-phosphate oxidase superfamily)
METLSRIRQHPERSVPEEAAQILAVGHVAHVGFEQNGQPFILPFSYHFDPQQPERLYLHGSRGSRTMQALTGGARVCVTVTLLDGLVFSRDALHHSMNYRSVVCFGRAQAIEGEAEKQRVLAGMIARYFDGRSAPRDYEAASAKELAATQLLAVKIEEWSAKVRRGPANGPRDHEDEREAGTQTYGVIHLPQF